MKVLILAAGADEVAGTRRRYPVALSEFDGRPVIELTLDAVSLLNADGVIVAVRDEESTRSHLDEIVRLIDPGIQILRVRNGTAGAACTALLAVDSIDDDELLILNANEIIETPFVPIVRSFRDSNASAGVITFPAVHPRYSYVRLQDGIVIEAAEKRPISRSATAGFYWFRSGLDFIEGAKRMIAKDASVDGAFYICPVLNELILDGKAVHASQIEASRYHPLKDDRQVTRFESSAGDWRHEWNTTGSTP